MYNVKKEVGFAYVEAAGWLVDTGEHRDDGHPVIKEVFYVWLTLRNGQRFSHERSFSPLVEVCPDYGYAVVTGTKEAKAKAAALATRIQAAIDGGAIPDLDGRWHEIEPAYGSDAYQSQGIEAMRCEQEKAEG